MTVKFTDLPSLAAVDIADDDVLAVSDISAAASKKVTVADLLSSIADLTQLQVEDPASTVFGQVSGERLAQAIQTSREKGGAIVATTSGTAFDFTGIPAEVQEIEVLFDGVSLTGTDDILIQLGTSGGLVVTGYTSSCTAVFSTPTATSSTSGGLLRASSAARFVTGSYRICRVEAGSNVWALTATGAYSGIDINAFAGGGSITLGAELDRVRITRTGTNTFDAGQLNVRWK